MKKNIIITLMSLILLSGVAQSVFAQSEFIRNRYLRLGFHAKLWEFEDDSGFLEVALPMIYSMPMGRRFALDVVASPFGAGIYDGSLRDPSNGEKIISLSDTYVRASYIIGDNQVLLTVGFGIPSGKTELNNEEFTIASIAANRALANPVSNFGTGSNVNVGLAFAREIGSWVFGFGVGFSRRGEYNLNALGGTIDPGDEINVTIGADKNFGSAKFTGDVIYTMYKEDQSNVLSPYQAGDKLYINGRLIFTLGFLNPVILSAGNRIRADNSSRSQTFQNGNEFEARVAAVVGGDNFGLKFVYLMRNYGDGDQDAGGATINGFGGGLVFKISQNFTFDPTFIYSTGSFNTGKDTKADVTGYELTGGFAFRF